MTQFKLPMMASYLALLLLQGCGGSSTIDKNDLTNLSYDKNPTIEKKVLYVTSKTDVKADKNITTTYTYKDKYLSQINIQSTDGLTDKKTYKYFENHKVMKTYDMQGNVESVSTFSNLNNSNSKYLYDRRLSLDENVNYLIFTNDTVTHHNDTKIKKFITIHTTGNIYTYDNSNLLLTIENGIFTDTNAMSELENDENTSYLIASDTPLSFTSSQTTTYNYDANHILTGITFEGQSGKLEADANVTFYDDGMLKKLEVSTGDSFVYNKSGYLTTKTTTQNGSTFTENYTYSKDLKTITVKDADGRLVKEYKFNEIK